MFRSICMTYKGLSVSMQYLKVNCLFFMLKKISNRSLIWRNNYK